MMNSKYLEFKRGDEVFFVKFTQSAGYEWVKVYKDVLFFNLHFKICVAEYFVLELAFKEHIKKNRKDYFLKISEVAVDTYIEKQQKKLFEKQQWALLNEYLEKK